MKDSRTCEHMTQTTCSVEKWYHNEKEGGRKKEGIQGKTRDEGGREEGKKIERRKEAVDSP